MINCEHVIVQCVVSLFFQFNFNKLYPISVTNIVEITYTISGTSQNKIVQGICREKSECARGKFGPKFALLLPPATCNNLS